MLMIVAAAALAAAGPAPEAALGRWKTESRNGIVAIERCGASICGNLLTSDGLRANPALTDINNKNPAQRNRPLRGLSMLSGFTRGDGEWTGGTIYNPEDGKTYSAKVTPQGPNTLKVRGCIFVPLCKTQIWTRVR